jgi:aspartate/methionine/tyrosine aminotransferase
LVKNASQLLVQRHVALEEDENRGYDGNFISGWQCVNPYALEINQLITNARVGLVPSSYQYAEAVPQLEESYRELEKQTHSQLIQRILFGQSSTQLLLLLSVWLKSKGIKEVFYVAPMYFTAHRTFDILGIRTRAINAHHVYEEHFSPNLPPQGGVLILTNPVWYAGVRLTEDFLVDVKKWQANTDSVVIIDGSFEYMRWAKDSKSEVAFETKNTFKIVCPTKQLCMHAFRAAYLLTPDQYYRNLLTESTLLYGSVGLDTLAFLIAAAPILKAQVYPRALIDLASTMHKSLRNKYIINAEWNPSDGYFCFERVNRRSEMLSKTMGGSFFEQPRYPEHVRINLLSPTLYTFDGDSNVGSRVQLN